MSVEKFLDGLDRDVRATVDGLRAVIAASHDGLVESIKWNAPSFAVDGEHRITLGLERGGGVRVVLHRGAKPKDRARFRFDDPDHLARWPDPDRGVLVLRDAGEVATKNAQLRELFRRWITATT